MRIWRYLSAATSKGKNKTAFLTSYAALPAKSTKCRMAIDKSAIRHLLVGASLLCCYFLLFFSHRENTRCAFAIRSACAFRSGSAGISNNFRIIASRAALNWCSQRGVVHDGRVLWAICSGASVIEPDVVIIPATPSPPLTSFCGCRSRALMCPFFVRRQTERTTLILTSLSCILALRRPDTGLIKTNALGQDNFLTCVSRIQIARPSRDC